MPTVRLALEDDLPSLLELFACAEVSAHAEPIERARAIWAETLASDATDVFVAIEAGRVAATCMLITVPNLLRGGRRLGVLENVASHPAFRRGGYGRAVVEAALQAAWAKGCFHVSMQSGRQDPAVHRFYKDRGFIGGLRTAYVAHNPALGDVDALIAARPPGR
ncbi:MAG TPA: GNAT family N-acetyltransferase [Caulobacteraceae bacterium]|jgi:GNAT superfamily N-acetyltransferase|nr:GNAT family N-acetyltransferase [Caulobacteraceae bacterium]